MSASEKLPKPEADYDRMSEEERARYVQAYYDAKKGDDPYATSPDFNLRELEIDFILKNISGKKVLDLGCGNGLTLIRIGKKIDDLLLTGVDFSHNLIEAARVILEREADSLKSVPTFIEGDATQYSPDEGDGTLDTVITERFLLNLPTDELQFKTIDRIHSMLKPNGLYIMLEGSQDGLNTLNQVREMAGLEPILDRDSHNVSSRKFDDQKLISYLEKKFRIEAVRSFDLYYLISRVIYPRMVFPQKPRYDHFINEMARELTIKLNFESKGLGHVKGYLLYKL